MATNSSQNSGMSDNPKQRTSYTPEQEPRYAADTVNQDTTAPVAPQPFLLLATRHGKTRFNELHLINGNSNLDQLSQEGRDSIPQLIQALGGLTVKKLYSSPLDRAME